MRQHHVDGALSRHRQILSAHQIRGARDLHIRIRADDVGLGQIEYTVMQRCADRSCILEHNALQINGELVDLRVPTKLLGLP